MGTVVTMSETKSETQIFRILLPSLFIHPARKGNLVPFQRDFIQFYANFMG